MCKRVLENETITLPEGGSVPPSFPAPSVLAAWMEKIKLVGYGVDTLVLNAFYTDEGGYDLDESLLPVNSPVNLGFSMLHRP